MTYINSESEYPRHYGDIKLSNPGWELGEPLPDGWFEVQEIGMPEIGDLEVAEEQLPELVDGVYVQKWVVRNLTDQEIEEKNAPASALAKLNAAGLTEYERKLIALGIVK